MGKLIDEAKQYTAPATTKNIADLKKVPLDVDVLDDSFEFEEDGMKRKVNQKIVVVEGEKYRVPNIVLHQIKIIAQDNPNVQNVRVIKSGEGIKTTYQVIPLM